MTIMTNKIIILIGPICAGKSEVTQLLKQNYGFHSLRFSQLLEEELINRGLEINRQNLSNIGNLLRQEYGSNALSVKLMEKINRENYSNVVIDGARNPSEIEYIRNNAKNWHTIALVIDAPQEVRFQRIQARKREGDPQTFEEFKKRDDIELHGDGSPHAQRIIDCITIADETIRNTGQLEQLNQILENLIQKSTKLAK